MHTRKNLRLEQYDYGQAGAYFVTVCTANRKNILSTVVGGDAHIAPYTMLTPMGKVVQKYLCRIPGIGPFVIMPNHVHAVLILDDAAGNSQRPTITDIVCAYKSLTTRACKKVRPIEKLFQTSFYEHVIRGREDYNEIAEYIVNNPKQWELDKLYSEE